MSITFIGFGEAGSAFVRGWGPDAPPSIRIYDIKTDTPDTAPDIASRAAKLNVTCCASRAEALEGAQIVFCTVTADQAGHVAQAAACEIAPGTLWLDLNSCAPATKRQSAKVIEDAGGLYVDVAVMAPVHPKLNMVPCLISGPHATDVAPLLAKLPMDVRVIPGEIGAASSIKMIRSVMVKGLEALTSECMLAAVAAGVQDDVVASLSKSYPEMAWRARAVYNYERMLVHGARRAAEMEEAAKTLADLGVSPDVTAGTIAWQRRMADLDVAAPDEREDFDQVSQALLAALRRQGSDGN